MTPPQSSGAAARSSKPPASGGEVGADGDPLGEPAVAVPAGEPRLRAEVLAPARQYGRSRTWSPASRRRRGRPRPSLTAAPSLDAADDLVARDEGRRRAARSPSTSCRSVRQTAQAPTPRSSSPGAGSGSAGPSSRSGDDDAGPGSRSTSARTIRPYSISAPVGSCRSARAAPPDGRCPAARPARRFTWPRPSWRHEP